MNVLKCARYNVTYGNQSLTGIYGIQCVFHNTENNKTIVFTALEPGQSIRVSQHQNHSRFTPISYHPTNYYCRTNTL